MDPDSADARLAREIAPGEQLLWSGRPRQGLLARTVESVPLRNIPQLALTTRADGSGDIRFGPPSPFGMPNIPGWPGMKAFSPLAFEGIPGARQVHDLIQRAQGEAP